VVPGTPGVRAETEVTIHTLEIAVLTLLQAMPTYGYDLWAALPALGFPCYVRSAPDYDALKLLLGLVGIRGFGFFAGFPSIVAPSTGVR
jgi:hypothetical protein